MENKKKAADFGGGQQPEKNRSQIDNVPLTEGEVKYFEGLILKEMYRRGYAAGNWQLCHYN